LTADSENMSNRDLQPEDSSLDARMADLYQQNFRLLYLFIRSRVGTDEQAEDLCAEAFIKAWENLANFKAQASFKTWLFSIARNLLIDFYRAQSRWRFLPWNVALDVAEDESLDDALGEDIPDEEASDAEIEVEALLRSLPESQATVLSLRFLANCTVKETARIMDLSEANVKVLQHRAIKKIRA
jgi:RNA polymerase sigma-70 factor (ECF subfamily)